MALSQFSETPGEPGWVLFEKRSWKSATEQFKRSVKEKELDLALRFLEKQGSVDEARTACQAANREAGARYSTEKSFSFSVGHKKIVPKALVIKLLGNLDTFTKAGDVAFKGGPESVGAVWVGVKFALDLVKSDYEACELLTGCFADIVGIFTSCRLYAKLYGDSFLAEGLPEVQERVREMIPGVIYDILDFSFSATKFVDQGEPERWLKEVFRSSKVKYEGKATAIRNHHATLISRAEQAAHEENTIRGRATTADLSYIRQLLTAQKEQWDEEKKNMKKVTFADIVQNEFENNIRSLNADVPIEALHKRNLDRREPGTCEWIFGLDEFKTWCHSEANQVLGITGEAGFGKSILLSSVIAKLQEERVPGIGAAGHDGEVVVHYFFCRTGNDNTQLLTNILGNIVYQLYNTAKLSPKLLDDCNIHFKEKEGSRTKGSGGASSVRPPEHELYTKLARTLKKQIYLVVDALDECSDSSRYGLLQILKGMAESKDVQLKILVSARPDTLIQKALSEGSCQEVQMKRHNGPDIQRKVAKGLESIAVLSEQERDIACQKIADKAEGEFNYVDTAINVLRQPWRRFEAGKQRSLEDILDELPHGMHGSYKLAFEQTEPLYVELAKTCLTWALLSEGEVKVVEIMDAYTGTFGTSGSALVQQEFTEGQMKTIADQMEKAAGPFLEIDMKSKFWTIKLRHASVKDYFLKSEAPAMDPLATTRQLCTRCGVQMDASNSFFVYEKQGHLAMATTTLRHLNSPLFQKTYLKIRDKEAGDIQPLPKLDQPEQIDRDLSQQATAGAEGPQSGPSADSTEKATLTTSSPRRMDNTPSTGEVTDADKEGATNGYGDREGADEANLHKEDADVDHEAKEDGHEVEAESDDADSVGSFIDLEDDFLEPEKMGAEAIEQQTTNADLRYEITHWVYHVKEAEKLWTKQEMETMSEWKELWDLLEEFLYRKPEAFEAWKRLSWGPGNFTGEYWDFDAGPMHLVTIFGLSELVEQLVRRGYDISATTPSGEVPLHYAARATHFEEQMAETLLRNGANPNFITDAVYWSSPPFLTMLVWEADFNAVNLFIRYGADCTLKNTRGDNSLHTFACWGEDPKVLQLLLENGAEINVKDASGETPLHILLRRTDAPIDLVKAFLGAGADVRMEDRRSQQPLYEAALAGNFDAACELLKHDPGLDLTDQDCYGMTAMHNAAFNGSRKIVELLHQKGAPLNDPDKHGRTPLYFACQGKKPETAEFLLQNLLDQGFDQINREDNDGRTPLRKAARHNLTGVLSTFLRLIPSSSVLDLKDKKAGRSVMHVAAYNGHLEAVRLLLDEGANVDLPDSDGKTALMLCHEGWAQGDQNLSEATIVLLIEKTSRVTEEYCKYLSTAARKGSTKVIQALLDCGVNIDAKDHHGWTALNIARQSGHDSAVDLLTKAGAEIKTRPTKWVTTDPRFKLSESGLELEYVGHADYTNVSALADHPIPAGVDNYYFEVEIQKEVGTGTNPMIGIGLTTNGVKLVDKMPGWPNNYPWWGYHGDDGQLFSLSFGRRIPGYESYERGDTVGCAVDFKEKNMFYTVNGKVLGVAFEKVNGQLFPVIGMAEKAAVTVNFGDKPFKWVKVESTGNSDEVNLKKKE